MRMRTQSRRTFAGTRSLPGACSPPGIPRCDIAQILPVALLLWGLDDVARFRAGAAYAGLQHAVVVNSSAARSAASRATS